MRKSLVSVVLATSALATVITLHTLTHNGARAAAPELTPAASVPHRAAYTQDGRLQFPDTYREWVYLSSGLDMSYRDRGMDHSMFDNVFADPTSYREFMRTGTWPDGAQLALETRGATEKGSINKSGKFQNGDMMGVEVHVKDTKRFAGGWAFFAFDGTTPAAQIPTAADCYSCHRDHAVVDTTFVQFYPTLLPVAKLHGTVRADGSP
jgi:cytochrome P460